MIDYGLRNPTGIQKIEAYELPSDDALIMKEVKQLICETCFLKRAAQSQLDCPAACGFVNLNPVNSSQVTNGQEQDERRTAALDYFCPTC
ncbi:MAG: hypothetical protein V8T48_05390 [Oscillospiraceae bacterium]